MIKPEIESEWHRHLLEVIDKIEKATDGADNEYTKIMACVGFIGTVITHNIPKEDRKSREGILQIVCECLARINDTDPVEDYLNYVEMEGHA